MTNKFYALLALCLLMAGMTYGQEQIVEKPWYSGASDPLEISKVILSEDRTVVEATFYGNRGTYQHLAFPGAEEMEAQLRKALNN